MKNNKGVTLVALMITIIVMLIIAGIAVYSGTGLIKQAKVEDVKTNMLLLEGKVKNYVEQAKFEGKNTINGITIDGVTLSIEESPEVSGYYKIQDMGALKLGDLSNQEYLIKFDINQVLVDVCYAPGITDEDGKTYHYLSEFEQ